MRKDSIQTPDEPGILYLVATPIGNLEDMTFRAVRILSEVDELYCEDTRHAQILLRHFKISRKTQSFHEHSTDRDLHRVRTHLAAGKSVAYISDSGLPVVSDPGFVLVRAAYEMGCNVHVVPGANAAVTLFAVCNLPSPKFFFHGFFPRVQGEVEKVLTTIRSYPVVHLFYESPQRVLKSLDVLKRNLPGNFIVLGRELTKLHEEVIRGLPSHVFDALSSREKVRGEIAFAIMGGMQKSIEPQLKEDSTENLQPPDKAGELTPEQQAEVAELVHSGVSSKDAAKMLSKKFDVPRKKIYDHIIKKFT